MSFLAISTTDSKVCWVDIVLTSPVVGEGSMTVSAGRTFGPDGIHDFTRGTVQGSCARIIAWTKDGCLVYTVNAGEDGMDVVARELGIDIDEMTWDGFTGRLCTFKHPGYITVHNFV
jgi:hypothetical protein